MKYGKEFQQILEASDFPDDWKTSAIEYGKLKKLIKNVVAELEGMGLPPSVLHQLLVTDASGSRQTSGSSAGTPNAITELADDGTPLSDDNVFEFEFELENGDRPHAEPSVSPKEVLVDPVFDEYEPLAEPGASGSGSLPKEPTHRFRLRMLSDMHGGSTSATPAGTPRMNGLPLVDDVGSPRPVSVTEMLRTRSDGATSPPQVASPVPSGLAESRRIVHRAGTDGGNVSAEYVLAGDEANPVPQIRLNVSNFDVAGIQRRLSTDTATSTPASTCTDLPTDDEDSAVDAGYDDELPPIPASPALLKMRTVASPIWAIASAGNTDGMAQLCLGEAVDPDDEDDIVDLTTPTMPPAPANAVPTMSLSVTSPAATSTEPGEMTITTQKRQFIIPLQSDVAFFNVLTAALKSLSEFHAAQQEQFHAAVDALCKMISHSIQPGDKPIVLPTPPNSGPSDGQMVRFQYPSSGSNVSHKDLYVWREIFALWIESEIFESSAERDRGERTVAEAERRLQVFANEVVRRGLGDRRSLKGRRTRKAWDEFLRLNVLLLDLKRFQMANINAARKILKKHDKRTALTASTGLAAFVRSTLTAHVDKDGHVSTWTFYNTSLPHVLLASLTNTLLPILPSLDDYSCLICMSIAFKPIRLSCGHLFCVRCLVKMQQRRKEQCPLCRAPSVLLADKTCLDSALMNFMKDWFPKEVREKQRENTAEIAREQLEDAGLDTRCLIM